MSEHIIVTGGAGFIGSHTVDLLLKNEKKVIVIDNCSTGRLDNLSHLKNERNLEVLEADINDKEKTSLAYKHAKGVIHLAALADIVPSIERPMDYHYSNVNGTLSVLENCRLHNIQRFVYAASSSCYGIPDEYPTKETAEIRPQYPYALTKFLGEQYVMHWAQVYKLPALSLRFFNVYGPRSRTSGTYGAVFGVFLAQKIHNQPFTIVGDGTQSRDFTYVTDVASAVYAALTSTLAGEVLNVGSGNHYSVNRIADLLIGEKTFVPKRPGEPDITFADISKIKNKLNWEPKISIEAGVGEMLKNIDYWKNAPVWNVKSIEQATKSWFQYLGK
ncbi:MAG: SDR family oxidoreductase [Oligoflexia bacterium]|nr:SDR family oxidoreductase [Oligoflexia bacterium]